MSKLRSLLMAGLIVVLGACTNFGQHSEIDALNEAQAVGSPFTQYLTEEYRLFANHEMYAEMDYPDALHFARKGLAAAAGEVVMPEPISDWNLLPHHMEELSTARGRLLAAFDLGAREIAPRQAAIAQVRFDCWIEQQEENWQLDDIAACKTQFLDAIAAVESMIEPMAPVVRDAPAPSAPPLPVPAEPMTPADAMYLVFFDFDKSVVEAGGQSVLDAIADEAKRQNISRINVVGHTDSAGPAAYNERLAVRRANSVRDGLVARGVDASMISVSGRGQNELLVETADNVREPANRRAQITFE